jgi:hypothetical protein
MVKGTSYTEGIVRPSKAKLYLITLYILSNMKLVSPIRAIIGVSIIKYL